MKKTLAAFIALLASQAALAAKPAIQLVANHSRASEPLTTEKVWSVEPDEPNPHRLRWALDRKTELRGLHAVEFKHGRYKVEGSELRSDTTLYVRGPGPWYQPITNFGCWQEPVTWFATEEGTSRAGEAAAAAWKSILSDRIPTLMQLLGALSEENAGIAMLKARYLFRAWLQAAEQEWHARAPGQARMAEWRAYLNAANREGVCKPGARPREVERPRWEERMELPAEKHVPPQLIARAPAKRLLGFYTIKVGVNIAGQTLVGQFLVDTGASMSVMSPSWLLAQGVNPKLLEVPGAPPQAITYSGGHGMARRIEVDGIEVSGLTAPLNDFLLLQTDLLGPPESKSACCSGILGLDFLRLYAVELDPGDPSVVKIWNRGGFDLGRKMPWVEASIAPSEGIVSECEADPAGVIGARWDTGSQSVVTLHGPWRSRARAEKGSWSIHCGKVAVATGLETSQVEQASDSGGPFASRLPGFTIGAPLIARGSVVFDLSHGRIWLAPSGTERLLPENRSGIELKFGYEHGSERVLRVVSLRKGTAAQKLIDAGLKPGTVVTDLNGSSTGSLDRHDVEEILAGERSSLLNVEWKVGKQKRSASTFLPEPR